MTDDHDEEYAFYEPGTDLWSADVLDAEYPDYCAYCERHVRTDYDHAEGCENPEAKRIADERYNNTGDNE